MEGTARDYLKMSIKKIPGRAYVNLVTLQTVITEVEATLNDCPITYLSDDISDPELPTQLHQHTFCMGEGLLDYLLKGPLLKK